MAVLAVVAVIVVVAIVVGLSLRDRGGTDGVDSFRRQIDALSPEARKPTVDRVKSAERFDHDGRDGHDRADDPGFDHRDDRDDPPGRGGSVSS